MNVQKLCWPVFFEIKLDLYKKKKLKFMFLLFSDKLNYFVIFERKKNENSFIFSREINILKWSWRCKLFRIILTFRYVKSKVYMCVCTSKMEKARSKTTRQSCEQMFVFTQVFASVVKRRTRRKDKVLWRRRNSSVFSKQINETLKVFFGTKNQFIL